MIEKTTATENATPHRTAHHTKKSALAADLDYSITPYHTRVNRARTQLTSIGTKAATERNGQNEQNDTSEEGIKTGGTTAT
jgi:hypothetical protein